MLKYICALFCVLLVLSALEPIQCRKVSTRGGGYSRGSRSSSSSHRLSGSGRGGSHGSPSSSGSHRSPPSGGLSGSGSSHGYLSPRRLSGGGSKYPPAASGGKSGGSHGYPPNGGLSGGGSKYPSPGGSGYPSSSGGMSGSGSHGYPNKPSGGSSYPSSNGGLSGSGSHGYTKRPNYGGRTTINNHYHYSPPQQINYTAPGHRPVSYPVYHGSLPPVVYQYKNSGSKYGTLLAGLKLWNLGKLAALKSNNHKTYKPQPGEICKFAIRKANGDYEEAKIDCQMVSSFTYQKDAKAARAGTGTNTIVKTTTVTNVTVVNSTSTDSNATTTLAPPSVLYQMLHNGTLVPVNVTVPSTIPPPTKTMPKGTLTSMTVTTTTTNTTVVNALDVKGKEVEVTPGMECFVIRFTQTKNMKRNVPCGLLQSYATQSLKPKARQSLKPKARQSLKPKPRQSLKPNSAVPNIPTFTILIAVAALFIIIII